MRSVCGGGTQQRLFLLTPQLWSLNMAGDSAKVWKKGAEVSWGLLPAFYAVAHEGLSGDRLRASLKSQRKRQSSRSSSNPGISHKVLSTTLVWKRYTSLYTVAQRFCAEPGKSVPCELPLPSH